MFFLQCFFSFVQRETAYKESVACILFIQQAFVECLLCASYLVDFPKRLLNTEDVKSCSEFFTHLLNGHNGDKEIQTLK